MNPRQMAAMAEATSLTRQGRLIEATALIQRALASPAVTRQAPDARWAGEETGGKPGRRPARHRCSPAGDTTGDGSVPGW